MTNPVADLPYLTADLPGVGGVLRQSDEDFRVDEQLPYEPTGTGDHVFVRIEKLDRGPGALGVEIVRSRTAPVVAAEDEAAPHPRVVFLSNTAILSPTLSATIDQLAADGVPVIFCVGLPEADVPVSEHKMVQRRIDLLAIEQNAWVLAGRDHRCVVTGTRTELDWAMKNDQITVWAPSKMVLDAVDRPDVAPEDALGLAVWFAEELSAVELVTVGVSAPQSDIPVRAFAVG